jgi:transcription initiation factor TFIID subunit TAF12
MFTDCGFSLGTTDKIRLKVVQHFRLLTKQKLSYLLNGIIDKISSENNNINIDLSEELLSLGSLLNL